MKAMTLRLKEADYERLRTIARAENRTMASVVRQAIDEYIEHRATHATFRDALTRAMQDNAELLSELDAT